MFLKKHNLIIILIISCNLFSNSTYSKQAEVITYLNNLKNSSFSFLQKDGPDISEGEISLGLKRVRVDYNKPSKILIILDEDKAMYYNYELNEDEFFNPKNTPAWFFYEIFNNPLFFFDDELSVSENNLILKKNGFIDLEEYSLEIIFENNPIVIRKINVKYQDTNLTISVFNHNYNAVFEKNFFKLINPDFFN